MPKKRSVTEGHISTIQFFNRFPDEQTAREHVERLRWGSTPSCVHCGNDNIAFVKNEKPQPYRCRSCRKFFSVKTNTLFHSSKLRLREILYAIYLISISKKGVSSCQLARDLGVTQKTAWYLEQRIRESFENNQEILCGIVEIDECYIGGKEKNRHANKKLNLGRGVAGKQPVVGIKSRESNTVIATPVKTTTKIEIQALIHSKVERGTTVYTDDHKAYDSLDIGGKHETVKHSAGEYVRGLAHTNGIESFWAMLKRGYYGTFHHFSVKHMHRYVNEFTVRQNRLEWHSTSFIDQTVRDFCNRKLGYRRLIQ